MKTHPASNRLNILGLTFDQLSEVLARHYGKGAFHAAAMFRRLHGQLNPDIAGTPEVTVSKGLAARLAADLWLRPGTVTGERESGGTVKFVTRLHDGLTVESVVLPMRTHQTVCVSTQAGCRMGCRFCETGKEGLKRHLTADEIVGQVWNARRRYGSGIRNVVFMGMGEPFDNFDPAIQAVRVLSDQRGMDIAPRYITVSTVGLVDGIEKLAALNMPHLKLAVSLNAPNDRIRTELMPVNKAWPLEKLRQALLAYPMKKDCVIMVAYVLIPGVNDHAGHASELARYLRPLPAKVNLIPFNPGTDAPFRAPSEEEVRLFSDRLVQKKVQVQRRTTKGRDLMAACGQLGSQYANSGDRHESY